MNYEMNKSLIFRFVVRRKNGQKIGETTVSSKNHFAAFQCDHPCHADITSDECVHSLPGYKNREYLQSKWDAMNEDRVITNALQPQYLRNYTETGFIKIKMPDELFQLLNDFYQPNKDSIVLEKWPASNPYINHWDAPPMMIWLPEQHSGSQLKNKIFDILTPILEEWSGTELERTDLYGMRVYKKGMFLENHVDRVATHVISTIMHVADSDDHHWPLEIQDHQGTFHNVTIAPGEMVLYESSTCPHGRPSKFEGEYYVNCFAHFRPKDWISQLRALHAEGKLEHFAGGQGTDAAWRQPVEPKDEL
jgi:hypothetical protein